MPTASTTTLRWSRLLLTGAAGHLGRVLRPRLKACCDVLRLSDVMPLGDAAPGEELVPAALGDKAAVMALCAGVDAIVHLGGVSTEKSWESILDANIAGLLHLYEGARAHGVRRVVFASSNHVTGFYRQDEVVSPRDPVRPDGLYGLSKAFGENLAQLYFDKHGIETVCLRIGTATPTPPDARALATWLSLPDLVRLVTASLTAADVGCTIAWGMSANTRAFWRDDGTWARLGYQPQDNAEAHAAAVQHLLQPEGPQRDLQGGAFLARGPYDPS